MKSVTYLLARRYLWNSSKQQTVWRMMLISFISIFIGSFSLTLITAIMSGFEDTVHQKMQNIHPAATIYAATPIAVDAVERVIKKEFPEVSAVSPQAIGHVLLELPDQSDTQPTVALLKGVHPDRELEVSAIGNKVESNRFKEVLKNNQLVIGKALARKNEITLGETISLFYLEPASSNKKVTVEHTSGVVGALFDTGIDEYDSGALYCNHTFFDTIFPEYGITQIGLAFKDNVDIPNTVARLQERLGFSVQTWQELYPALISALTLEKYAMFFILLLITCVASMNIIALLFMLITYKKSDIAILHALGMRPAEIQRLFITIGMGLATAATTCGIAGAWGASILLERYPFITLPDAYYVTHLPAKMTFAIAFVVSAIVCAITLAACWHATRRIKCVSIADILRFEG